ncbi:MAG: YbaK/EbsC family protein [Chloroflexota bacterium]
MAANIQDVGAVPQPRLLEWLRVNGVDHEIHEHATTITATATARAEGIDPRRFAKTVCVIADDRPALVVVDAVDRIDLAKVRHVLAADDVRLASEGELVEFAPDFEVGTIPPIGDLFDARVIADFAVRDDPEISFHAGSHSFTVHVDRAAWERATHVVYADIALADHDRAAWASS